MWQRLYKKVFKKFHISEPLSGQRSAAGIFIKLKALDISLIMCYWKVFYSLISIKYIRDYIINLVSSKITYLCEIKTTCFLSYDVIHLYVTCSLM